MNARPLPVELAAVTCTSSDRMSCKPAQHLPNIPASTIRKIIVHDGLQASAAWRSF